MQTGIYAMHEDHERIDKLLQLAPTEAHEEMREIIMRRGRYFIRCPMCNEEFSNKNVHTKAGWLESQISGLCESCWNNLFEDLENG